MIKDKYRKTGTPEHLIEWIEAAHISDKKHETRETIATCFVGLFALGLIGSLVVMDTDKATAKGLLALIVFGFFLVLAGVFFQYSSDRNLDDTKVAMTRRLLKYLSLDLLPQRECDLTVDFKKCFQDDYKVSKNGQLSFHKQEWLSFQGILRNRAVLRLSVRRDLRTRETHSVSGNRKLKQKFRDVISIRLKAPFDKNIPVEPGHYGNTPEGLRLKEMRLDDGKLRVQLVTDRTVTKTKKGDTESLTEDLTLKPEVLTQALLWLFRGLQHKASG